MKKIFISLSFLMMAFLPVFAQNSHWDFLHTICGSSGPITSAVTVVHSNGTAYLFETDSDYLFVTEINPTNMNPNPSSYGENIPNVILQGAYEDFNGDIVIYGCWDYNNSIYPAAALYDVSTYQITKIVLDINHIDDNFINGCCGYDLKGDMVNMLVLDNAGVLECFEWYCPQAPYPLIDILEVPNSGFVTDVSWDSYNNCFAAVGYQHSLFGPELFLLKLEYDASVPSFLVNSSSFSWFLPNYTTAEYRTSVEIIDAANVVVGHSVRDSKGDEIWLTRISNYSTIANATTFQFPAPKIFISDMKFDEIPVKKLSILGQMNFCGGVNYIAQVDPITLSGMNAAQITGSISKDTCVHNQDTIYGNAVFLQKLEKNPQSCMQILATGPYKDKVYLTETYDIASSSCDIPIPLVEQPENPQPNTVSYNSFNDNILLICVPVSLINLGGLYSNNSCVDLNLCTKNENDSTKNLKILKEVKNADIINMGNGCFYFQGFANEIHFTIYDALGRKIAYGKTTNRIITSQLNYKGLYIISAKDKNGTAVTKKFIFIPTIN